MKARNVFNVLFSLVFMLFATQGFARDDAAITDEIKTKLSQNETLAPFNIDVITKDGIVNLKGVVDTDPNAGTIIEIAQATEGVSDVYANNLKIKSRKHPFQDTLITAKVKGTFLRDKLFTDKDIETLGIHVKTTNGVVYLTGKTNDQAEIDNAISIARSIKGVKSVQSKLKVKTMTN